MHQQVRLVLGSTDIVDGSGAMAVVPVEVDPREVEQGALLRVLELLAAEGYNLRIAGGRGIETGGEFVFAVDDDGDEGAATKCAAFLHDKGYRDVRVIEPYLCEVDDRVGALRDCLATLAKEGRHVDELFVGTPRKGKIPVQVTTIVNVGERKSRGR
jgi:hypothetical protein